MRILFVSNLYPPLQVGGYEQRCSVTARWLAREHEVVVLTSRHRKRSLRCEPDVLRRLPLLSQDWRGTLRAPLASLYAALFMRRLVRRLRPDLVFVWNASGLPRAALCVATRLGCAMAFSVADPWFGGFVEGDQFLRYLDSSRRERGLRGAWASLAKLVNRLPGLRIDPAAVRPAAIVWNSEALRRLTPVPPSFTAVLERVIHPASENEQLFAGVVRSRSPLPTIAFVGRLESQKAPDVAVRALGLLRERHGIEARLVVAGSGDEATVRLLERLTSELSLKDRVELRGRLSPSAVAQVLGESDALLVPSRWQEPFGLVCVEGALARVPVVASISGGMPEMLASEREALFFPIDDVEACAAALARTLTDEAATAQRVQAAFQRAQTYSMRRHNSEYDRFVVDAVQAIESAQAAQGIGGAQAGQAIGGAQAGQAIGGAQAGRWRRT